MHRLIFAVVIGVATGCSRDAGIEGAVQNQTDGPIPGVTVRAIQKSPVKGYERFETATDDTGVFRFESLFPHSEYELSLQEGVESIDLGYAPAARSLTRTVETGAAGYVRILEDPIVVLDAGTYEIARQIEGPFSFTLYGVRLNPGSSMERESVVFNEPSCPVEVVGNELKIVFEDRRFQFTSETSLALKQNVAAIELRHVLYDVFGQHMRNLSNLEARDLTAGDMKLSGTWNSLENDVSELLTTVTYVARVRLKDGTQWIFNQADLFHALESLNLEQRIEVGDS